MPNFRTIRIFISSTFRDMDFERDEIKFKVIPWLNAHYASSGLTFQAVDLRIGVNTSGLPEDVRENKVLDVCLNSIDEARPFFIGLLGGRYGWIPSDKRFRHILKRLSLEKRPLISGAADRSVTELEILYGAIGNKGQYIDHSLFFFRDPISYKEMNPYDLKLYTDYEKTEHTERLSRLRKHIEESTQDTSSQPVTYSIHWDADKRGFVDNDNSFANIVFRQLSSEIDKEIASSENEQTWYETAEFNDHHVVSTYLMDASKRRNAIRPIAEKLISGARIIMAGSYGMGKSTFLSLLTDYVRNKLNRPVLLAFPAINAHSLSPRTILAKWIDILSKQYDMAVPFPSLDNVWDYNLNQMRDTLENIAIRANVKPVIFIDDISLFEVCSSDAAYLSWIPKSFGLFITADTGYNSPALKIHLDIELLSLPDLDSDDTDIYFNCWEERNSNELGPEIRNELLQSLGEPRRITLLLNLIETFASDDFQQIREQHGEDEMTKITSYIISLIKSAPKDLTELINFLIDRITSKEIDSASLKEAITLLALSRCGLRDSDIEALLGKDFDMLTYVTLMNLLKYLFLDDRLLHKRNFRSYNLLLSYLKGITEPLPHYVKLANHTLKLPDSDPVRRDMLLFFLLQAGDSKAIVDNALFTPYNTDEKEVRSIARDYYGTSMQYALQADGEDNLFKRLFDLASEMDVDNSIIFIYNVLFHGFPELFQRKDMITRFAKHLYNIPINAIKNANASYALAWMQTEYLSIVKYDSSLPPSELIPLHKTTIECFEHSRKLDPEIGDPSNMITATAANLIPLYAQIGDFDGMNDIIKLI